MNEPLRYVHTWHLRLRQRHRQSLTLHQWKRKHKRTEWVWTHSWRFTLTLTQMQTQTSGVNIPLGSVFIMVLYHIYLSTLWRNIRSILKALPWGKDPLPRSFPISWYCKLDTRYRSQNYTQITPNATHGCKWTCCSDLPIRKALYQPGMVLLPRWTKHTLNRSTSTAPLNN